MVTRWSIRGAVTVNHVTADYRMVDSNGSAYLMMIRKWTFQECHASYW